MAKVKDYVKLQEYIELSTNNNEFVVFDIETTGTKVIKGDMITQISALKIKDNKVIDKFSEYVNPQKIIKIDETLPVSKENTDKIVDIKLSQKIIDLTGITDDILIDKRNIYEVLPDFLDFVGDCIVVAQNGNFDVGFIEYLSMEIDREFPNKLIDTVELGRYLYPSLSNHKLPDLASVTNVIQLHHHDADDDTRVTMEIFIKMRNLLLKEKGIKVIEEKPLFNILEIKSNEEKKIIYLKTSIGNIGYDRTKKCWLKGKNITINLDSTLIEETILKIYPKYKSIDEFVLYNK